MSYRTVEEYDRERWTEKISAAVRNSVERLLDPSKFRNYGPVVMADISAFMCGFWNEDLPTLPPVITHIFSLNTEPETITSRLVDRIMADRNYSYCWMRMQMMFAHVRGVPVLNVTLLPQLD